MAKAMLSAPASIKRIQKEKFRFTYFDYPTPIPDSAVRV
jgi:hypothetical protein